LTVVTRAFRNVVRRKIRVLLVVIALGFSMAIMISIPSGIMANQAFTQRISENYNSYIGNMEEEINKTLTLIECSLSGGFGGFGSQSRPGFMVNREENFLFQVSKGASMGRELTKENVTHKSFFFVNFSVKSRF
jgi:hypothetical protein